MHFVSYSLIAIEGHHAKSALLHFFLGYDIEETADFLAMLSRPDERYLSKYVCTGEEVAKKTRKPIVDLVGMMLFIADRYSKDISDDTYCY